MTARDKIIGAERIATAFETAKAKDRAALMPYLTLGYPTPQVSLDAVAAAAAAGADILELGLPFSDPLADGPVIQNATYTALQQGMTSERCLELVHELRRRNINTPVVLMGYYNPILAYGVDEFCCACSQAGVDGLIVPDLPPEEAETLEMAGREHGVALIYLLAPTSTPERIELVCQRSQGFVYLVSVVGTTGVRDQLPADLTAFVNRVRAVTAKALAVGFGISKPEQVRQLAPLADGVIVGSAIIRRLGETHGVEKVSRLVEQFRRAGNRSEMALATPVAIPAKLYVP